MKPPQGGSAGWHLFRYCCEELEVMDLSLFALIMQGIFRTARRHPRFAILVLVNAAIGIGSGVGIFTYMDALLYKPLPYFKPEQLIRISGVRPQVVNIPFSGPNLQDLRLRNRSLSGFAAYDNFAAFDLIKDGEPLHVLGATVSPEFFTLLGITPLMGRVFQPSEEDISRSHVVILSYHFWQQQFGGSPNLLGTTIRLNGDTFTVIGILRDNFWFPGMQDRKLWVPLSRNPPELNADDMAARDSNWLKVVARLRAGVTIAQAQSDVDRLSLELQREYPYANRDLRWTVEPFREWINRDTDASAPGLIALGALIIGIACTNLALLMLMRVSTRRKQAAIRLALGANRLQVYLEEACSLLLLCVFGGGIGAILSWIVITRMPLQEGDSAPLLQHLSLDFKIVLAFLAFIIISSIVIGSVALLGIIKNNWSDALRSYGFGTLSRFGAARLRVFLTCQIALATILVAGATMLYRNFTAVEAMSPGFDTQDVLTFQMDVSSQSSNPKSRTNFIEAILDRIRRIPGVKAAGLGNFPPFGGLHGMSRFSVVNSVADSDSSGPLAERNSVTPGFFDAMGIPFLAGNDFTHNNDSKIAIINSEFRKTFYRGRSSIGDYLWLEGENEPYRIVGVVGDTKRMSLTEKPSYYIYTAYDEDPARTIFVAVRVRGNPLVFAKSIQAAIHEIDPEQSIWDFASMEERVGKSLSGPRFSTGFIGASAALALTLALIGVYSIVSYDVAARTHEIGVRIALGARNKNIAMHLLRRVVPYIVGGVSMALMCIPVLRAVVGKWVVQPLSTNPGTLLLSSLGMICVSILAALGPVRRAARIEPIQSLRNE